MPLWLYDNKTLDIIAVNRAAEELYGYASEEFTKMNLFDIRPESERLRFAEHMNKIRNGELIRLGKIPFPWKHKKKNGEIIDVEITRDQILLGAMDVNLCLIKDVTEKNKIENSKHK